MAGVLVVEDEPGNRTLLESWLRWMGHDVLSAGSVAEATSMIDGTDAAPGPALDLAVLDIGLPDGSGLEILLHLRQVPAHTRIPAIFLSASHAEADRLAARALEAQFMAKPVSRSVLQAAVEAALT